MDSESLAFVDSLIESLPKAAMLLLVNFRPEFQRQLERQKLLQPHPHRSVAGRWAAAELLQDRLGDDSSLRVLGRC